MTLRKTIEALKQKSVKEQAEFCHRISRNIVLNIRETVHDDRYSEKERLDIIYWLNEFHHRVDNIHFGLANEIKVDGKIELLGKHAQHYGSKSEAVGRQIAGILIHS